ncbi:MAG: hypothetical protein O2816_04390 [Planctomycetota bacterium]|nr:hypothetical protein [Planctomycetota bacterium]
MGARTPDPLTCDDVPATVRAFVSRGLRPDETAALREHVADCKECAAIYHDGVETAAHIGGQHRTERVATEKAVRRWRLRRDSVAAQLPSPRGRSARIRTLLYPAFFAYLMVQIVGFGGPKQAGLAVEVLRGTVHASEPMESGELCATGDDGWAKLFTDDAEARLEPDTRLFLESTDPLRLRLVQGVLELEGTWQITTVHGFVELVEGRARLDLQGNSLACGCERGELRFSDARGQSIVEAGSRARFGAGPRSE